MWALALKGDQRRSLARISAWVSNLHGSLIIVVVIGIVVVGGWPRGREDEKNKNKKGIKNNKEIIFK